ncbi:MAG TPA: complex I NDUFA9 subunit family protein [Candidatus Angelobacter sp.]|nr:complex I NDUFA9 subunit family protein [Candidatus Angelobacter sp.]
MRVFLTGATGFVGRNVLTLLLAEGHSVRALVRDPQRTAGLPQTNVDYVPGDVVSGAGLDEGLAGCEAVIHLVGIIMEKGSNTFEAVHHLGTRHLVDAARKKGVKRFVQMSALGVRADGAAKYQTSKWKGEEAVRQSGIPCCILRPSLIFGPGDGFVTQMMDAMRKAPLFRPVPGDGKGLYRPIFVGDVATCFVRALTVSAAVNQTIALGGADELSLNQILNEIARCAGINKPAIHIPLPIMFCVAAVGQRVLRNPPVTIDQLRMLREGSTCDIKPMKAIFTVEPRGFEGCGRNSV